MFKPSEPVLRPAPPAPGPADPRPAVRGLVAVAFALLAAGPLAHAAATPEEGRSAFDAAQQTRSPAAAAPAPRRYQLRCWQEGRLVIEESGLELSPDELAAASGARASVRLRATGRDRQPIFLAETSNATCLVRPWRDEQRPGE